MPWDDAPELPGAATALGLSAGAEVTVEVDGEAAYLLQFLADTSFAPAPDFEQTMRRIATVVGADGRPQPTATATTTISSAMIEITTSSSISVKPGWRVRR